MAIANHDLARYDFPWALVSLIVIFASATLWGARAAVLVLALSALFVDVIMPNLHVSYFPDQHVPMVIRLVRASLFVTCGLVTIWMQHVSRRMTIRAERKQAILQRMKDNALPTHSMEVGGWDGAYRYFPAQEDDQIGGDFCDFFPIDLPHKYGVVIGDVMGKGEEAAAHTALARYSVRAFAGLNMSPSNILTRVNQFADYRLTSIPVVTTTLFVGILDAETGMLQYSSAGHEPPILLHTDGTDIELGPTGPVMGAGSDSAYSERAIHIQPGEMLLLVTDGVTEARNRTGEFLGPKGLRRMLHPALTFPSSDGIIADFTGRVMRYIGNNSRDDIAVVLLRRLPGQSPADAASGITTTVAAGQNGGLVHDGFDYATLG